MCLIYSLKQTNNTQAVFELGASAEAIDLFKIAFGTEIGDRGMGMCGVISSSLILYEGAIKAIRSEIEHTG